MSRLLEQEEEVEGLDESSFLEDQLGKLASDPMSGVNKFIYRGEPILSPPSDVDPRTGLVFSAPPFAGPTRTSARLHGFPRGGYTNDISTLSSYGGEVSLGGDALASRAVRTQP